MCCRIKPVGPSRCRQRFLRHVKLGVPGPTRQFFDRVSIIVAADEIHRRKGAVLAKQLVDEAHTFKKRRPIECRHEAHAGNNISYGYRHRRLSLVLNQRDLFGRCALSRESLMQPRKGGRHRRVLVAQTLKQFDGKRRTQRRPLGAV